MSIAELQKQIKQCRRCNLCTEIPEFTTPVPGVGKKCNIMFIGEAPGQDEQLEGEPFVGMCYRFFKKTLEKFGLSYKNVYVTNLVKCSPRKGKYSRIPKKIEIDSCKEWLMQELDLVQPKCIVSLGVKSTQVLFDLNRLEKPHRFGHIVGYRFHTHSYDIFPCWHPSYVLKYGQKKVKDFESVISLVKGYYE